MVKTSDGLELIIPMKARPNRGKPEIKSICNSDDYIADFKLDGDYFQAYYNEEWDKIRFFSRSVSVKTGCFTERTEHLQCLNYMKSELARFGIRKAVFCGEMMHQNGRDTLTSCIGGSVETSLKNQSELGYPSYAVFDILQVNDTSLIHIPLMERKQTLKDIMSKTLQCHIANMAILNAFPKWLYVPSNYDMNCDIKDFYTNSVERGFEGAVYKRKDSIYSPGYISNNKIRVKVSQDWIKHKIKREFDVVVLGFNMASFGVTGQFDGLIGAVVFGQYKDGVMLEIGQASGFDVATRKDMTQNPDNYIGKVAVIEAQERSKNNRLRHAQWKGLRTDKNPEDCIYDEDEC